jgi:hypothetical protein
MYRLCLQLRHPVRHIHHQIEAIKGVEHHHVNGVVVVPPPYSHARGDYRG